MPTAAKTPAAAIVMSALTDMLLSRAIEYSISSHGISVVSPEIALAAVLETIPAGSESVIDAPGSPGTPCCASSRSKGCSVTLVVSVLITSPEGRRAPPISTRTLITPSSDSISAMSCAVRWGGTMISMFLAMGCPERAGVVSGEPWPARKADHQATAGCRQATCRRPGCMSTQPTARSPAPPTVRNTQS
jgi:hypothetical protein